MKLLIASDIHGCLAATQQLLEQFRQQDYDYLVLLGDILNHGPRNPLPERYDPIGVAQQLNAMAEQIVAVRGNCDSEVDQALLNFPLLAEYNQLLLNGQRLFLSHGHLWSPDNLPPLKADDLFCFGHFHIPQLAQASQCWLLNPGSAAMPRGEHPASYASYHQGHCVVHELATGRPLLSATTTHNPA